MENPQKESYPSKKLIGELYRHLKSRACELQLAHTNNLGENIRPESRFLVPGRFSHILQAKKVYELYCTTMSVHMIRLGLKSGKPELFVYLLTYSLIHLFIYLFNYLIIYSIHDIIPHFKKIDNCYFTDVFCHFLFITETEIILGLPSQLSEGASADRGGVEREMKAVWSKIQKSFRSIFYEDMPGSMEVEGRQGQGQGQGQNGEEGGGKGQGEGSAWIFNRASAWYAVAYGIKSDSKVQTVHTTTPRGGRYLGFGWIMGDILCQIPARLAQPPALYGDANDTTTETPSFLLYFGHHLRAHWNVQSKELFETLKIKMSAFKDLDDALGSGSALLFGSVAQYLCDAYSDIDICVPVPVPVTAAVPITVPMTVTAAMTASVTAPVTVTVQDTRAVEGLRTLSFSDDVLEGIPRMATLSLRGTEEDERNEAGVAQVVCGLQLRPTGT